jgi:PIN domain nuclease of toxin-antitoxin system
VGVALLLDTHALLWALVSPDELSAKARELIEDPATILCVSAASGWEISTKHRLGKLPEAEEVVDHYTSHLRQLGAVETPISSVQAMLAGQFTADHRDPFDRMIAAQGIVMGLPILTKDPAFAAFPCRTIW